MRGTNFRFAHRKFAPLGVFRKCIFIASSRHIFPEESYSFCRSDSAVRTFRERKTLNHTTTGPNWFQVPITISLLSPLSLSPPLPLFGNKKHRNLAFQFSSLFSPPSRFLFGSMNMYMDVCVPFLRNNFRVSESSPLHTQWFAQRSKTPEMAQMTEMVKKNWASETKREIKKSQSKISTHRVCMTGNRKKASTRETKIPYIRTVIYNFIAQLKSFPSLSLSLLSPSQWIPISRKQ